MKKGGHHALIFSPLNQFGCPERAIIMMMVCTMALKLQFLLQSPLLLNEAGNMAIKEPFLFSTCQTLAHCKRPDIRELCTEFCCSSAAASM